MAYRVALTGLLPSACSAISFVHTASLRENSYVDTDASFLEAIEANAETELMPAVEMDCQEVKEGSQCHSAVAWLRKEGLATHPKWYPGYSSRSTFEEVQDMLHGLGKAQCPRPCFAKMPAALVQTSSSLKFDCHDAVEGDWCYHSINWLREKGLHRHPEWYPTLQPSSNNSWIQAELHRKGKSDCPWPCGLPADSPADEEWMPMSEAMESVLQPEQTTQDEQGEEGCRDAQPNTACYSAVTYGLAGGIKKHPEIFVGLTESADFKKVQEYLYLQNRNGCEKPCSQKRVDPRKFFKSATSSDSFREKKRIEDMSAEELSKYLDGKWDGYDRKNIKMSWTGDDVTSTFQKRDSIPTTTPWGAEEQQELPLINPESSKITAAQADEYDKEEFARKLREDKIAEEKMLSDATSTAAPPDLREKKSVEDMSKEELSEYLNGHGSVVPDLPALGVVSAERAIANDSADVNAEALPEVANASETEEAANGTEEFEALPALALENFSTVKVSSDEEEAGVSDEPMPAVDADGNFANPTEETPEEAERRMEIEQQPKVQTEEAMEMEQQPNVQTEEVERTMEMEQQPHVETPEEMERRIRAELMAKNEQALRESEEDMRARIKAEVMYDMSKVKGQ